MNIIARFSTVFLAIFLSSSAPASGLFSGVSTRMEPARSSALGGAGVAMGNDSALLWLNPGVLATCGGKTLSMGAQRGTAADLSSQIQWTSSIMGGYFSAGAGYYTSGSAEYWLPDGSSTMLSLQRDALIFAGWGSNIIGNIGAGLNLKAVRTEIAGMGQSWGIGADIGTHMMFSDNLSAGLAIQNMGSPVKWGKDVMAQPALVRGGVAVVFPVRNNLMGDPVDYLQLMQGNSNRENRQQEISEISRSLKALARELNVPVVALSQLSRAPESRSDHRPQLSDLRESGAIEQDADLVLFLYRDEYYHPDTDKKNIAEVIIAKQRNGPTGVIELAWLGQYTKFANIERYRTEE